jgi:Domain of unknown function (DUF222)
MFESDDRRGPEGEGGPTPVGGGSPGLAGLESMVPGPGLAGVLAGLDPAEIADAYDVVEIAAGCERLKAWADAIEINAAAGLAAHPVCFNDEAARRGFTAVRAAGQLLAPRLGQSPTTACNRVGAAVQLVDELGDTVAALSRGELDYAKAAALAVGVRALDPPDGCADAVTGESVTPDGIRRGLVARVEARVLPRAGVRSLSQHREAIAGAVANIAPKTAQQRHESACEQRRVQFRSEADGMAWLGVYGPVLDLTAVKVMLDAAAEAAKMANPDDPRTLDQLRVDTLSQLAWTILENGHLPDHDHDDDGDSPVEDDLPGGDGPANDSDRPDEDDVAGNSDRPDGDDDAGDGDSPDGDDVAGDAAGTHDDRDVGESPDPRRLDGHRRCGWCRRRRAGRPGRSGRCWLRLPRAAPAPP